MDECSTLSRRDSAAVFQVINSLSYRIRPSGGKRPNRIVLSSTLVSKFNLSKGSK